MRIESGRSCMVCEERTRSSQANCGIKIIIFTIILQ